MNHLHVITISDKAQNKKKLNKSLKPSLCSSILSQNNIKTRQNDKNLFKKKKRHYSMHYPGDKMLEKHLWRSLLGLFTCHIVKNKLLQRFLLRISVCYVNIWAGENGMMLYVTSVHLKNTLVQRWRRYFRSELKWIRKRGEGGVHSRAYVL